MAYGMRFVLYDQMRDTGVKMDEFTITLGGYFKVLPSQLADWPKCPSSTIKSNSNKSKAPEVCFLTSHTCRENWCALNFHYYDATAQYTYLFGKTGFKNWHMDVTYMTSWSYLNVSLIRLCCWNIQKHTWKTKMEWWFQFFHWFVCWQYWWLRLWWAM